MGNGYVRQSAADIIQDAVINAAPLNAEFNSIRDAFDGTEGHSHDGTVGEGQQIALTNGVTGVLPVANGGTGATTLDGLPVSTATAAAIAAHTSRTDNPHTVTAAQVGLGNVNNTSDADKPVSTATATAISTAVSAHSSLTNNPHATTAAQVGLGNVNNTSDVNKPVSTATQTALNGKANVANNVTGIERNTLNGWDQILIRLSDNSVRKVVADLSGNRIGMGWDGTNGIPIIRVDALDMPMATRAYADTKISSLRSVDIGWLRPTASSGDHYGGIGDYAGGFEMGSNGFVGVYWRRLQMFVNGSWQNIT